MAEPDGPSQAEGCSRAGRVRVQNGQPRAGSQTDLPAFASPRLPGARMERYGLNLDHSDIPSAILARIVETGEMIGRASPWRILLAVTVDDWLVDELAAFEAG